MSPKGELIVGTRWEGHIWQQLGEALPSFDIKAQEKEEYASNM